jgi:uncharacterized protein (DUF1778 family)
MSEAQSTEREDRRAITFRVSAELYRLIEEAAARELISVSAICRRGTLQSLTLNLPEGL